MFLNHVHVDPIGHVQYLSYLECSYQSFLAYKYAIDVENVTFLCSSLAAAKKTSYLNTHNSCLEKMLSLHAHG